MLIKTRVNKDFRLYYSSGQVVYEMKMLMVGVFFVWLMAYGAISFGDSSILQANKVYCAMNKPGDKFGRLTVGKDELSWEGGQKSLYRILKETKEYCIVELTTKPLPEFYGTAYRYIKFDSVEPDRGFELIGAGFSNSFDGSDIHNSADNSGEWFSYAILTP